MQTFFAIFAHHPKWNWNSLPASYLSSPYLSTDHVAVSNYFQPSVKVILQNEPRDLEVTTLPTLPENKVRNNVEQQLRVVSIAIIP